MIKQDKIVVIAAGGYATRMGSNCPKSLIEVRGKTLLEHSLDELSVFDLKKIIIHTNRIDYWNEYMEIISKYQNVSLTINKDYNSTFQIIKDYYQNIDCDLVFLYGHSPFGRNFYSKLLSSIEKNKFSVYLRSTKNNIIYYNSSLFIEPPYIISPDLLSNIDADTWSEFFNLYLETFKGIFNDAPNEFNNISEMLVFERFFIEKVL